MNMTLITLLGLVLFLCFPDAAIPLLLLLLLFLLLRFASLHTLSSAFGFGFFLAVLSGCGCCGNYLTRRIYFTHTHSERGKERGREEECCWEHSLLSEVVAPFVAVHARKKERNVQNKWAKLCASLSPKMQSTDPDL